MLRPYKSEGDSMFKLDGKTALVTGASQGIGEAVARLLAGQGARVVLAARNEEKLKRLAAEIDAGGGCARPLALDVSQPETFAERLKSLPEDFAVGRHPGQQRRHHRRQPARPHVAWTTGSGCCAPTSPAPSRSPRRWCGG